MIMDWLESADRNIAAKNKERRLACEREHRTEWRVFQRKCNHSAFNGYRRTPSDYSTVQCQAPGCGRTWRTKAAYVDEIPDLERT